MSKYVKIYNEQGLPLGFKGYNDVSSTIGDANVKVYDSKGHLVGMNEIEVTPPSIKYLSSPETPFEVIGEQIPFVKQDGVWVATEGTDGFFCLQFTYLSCTQGGTYDLDLTIEGQIEIDDEGCTSAGFPFVTIVRSTTGIGGEVSGTSPQGAWKIIYPIA